jgi:hypothetical protein
MRKQKPATKEGSRRALDLHADWANPADMHTI